VHFSKVQYPALTLFPEMLPPRPCLELQVQCLYAQLEAQRVSAEQHCQGAPVFGLSRVALISLLQPLSEPLCWSESLSAPATWSGSCYVAVLWSQSGAGDWHCCERAGFHNSTSIIQGDLLRAVSEGSGLLSKLLSWTSARKCPGKENASA